MRKGGLHAQAIPKHHRSSIWGQINVPGPLSIITMWKWRMRGPAGVVKSLLILLLSTYTWPITISFLWYDAFTRPLYESIRKNPATALSRINWRRRVFRIGISPHPLSPSFSPPTYPSSIPIPHYLPPSIFFFTHASQWSRYDVRERKSVDLVQVKYVLQLSKEPRTDKKKIRF